MRTRPGSRSRSSTTSSTSKARRDTIGKTAGKDAAQGKPTFVALLGVAGARERAEALRVEAQGALTPLGAPARRLSELADWIVLRDR